MIESTPFRIAGIFVALLAAGAFVLGSIQHGPWTAVGVALAAIAFVWLASARLARRRTNSSIR